MTLSEVNPDEHRPTTPETPEPLGRMYSASDVIVGLDSTFPVKEDMVTTRAYLPVELNNQQFFLPIIPVDVSPSDHAPEGVVYLAWFDPHPDRNKALAQLAAVELSQLLRSDMQLAYSPPTGKSSYLTRRAVGLFGKRNVSVTPVVEFLGADTQEEIHQLVDGGIYIDYAPVTKLTGRYMGAHWRSVGYIAHTRGQNLQGLDDVYSGGGTTRAM